MDAIDRKILAELQTDGRLTVTELAERVGLSVSPTHRRLRDLERAGAIDQYRAHLNPAVLGFTFEALVFVTMRESTRETITAFEDAVVRIPHVLQVQRLFGEPDYLLRVIAVDVAGYESIYTELLAALPGVQKLASTLVMKRVAENRPLPL